MEQNRLLEEKWNAYSHGMGIVLSILGTFFLLHNLTNRPYGWSSITIYCFTLILLFSASTLYHSVYRPLLKQRLRILDHISIYFLIAGTYTPVCLLILQESKGWLLFWLVWGITTLGTLLKLFFTGKFEIISLLLYGIMGWLIVIDLPFLFENVSNRGLFLLAIGGGFYTIGIFFYAIKKIPFNHLIWHFFVLAGAVSHWFFIYHELILKRQ